MPDEAIRTAADTDLEARTRAAYVRAASGELLTAADMMAIFRMSRSTWTRHFRAGAFDKFRTLPTIGTPRFSGVLVWRYLAGEALVDPSFGRATFGRPRGAR